MASDAITVRLPLGAMTLTAAAPTTISQRTVEAQTGIDPRHYLESLADYRRDGGEVMRLGRLRIVRLADYLTWLGRREPLAEVEQDKDDDIASRCGLKVAGGGR